MTDADRIILKFNQIDDELNSLKSELFDIDFWNVVCFGICWAFAWWILTGGLG